MKRLILLFLILVLFSSCITTGQVTNQIQKEDLYNYSWVFFRYVLHEEKIENNMEFVFHEIHFKEDKMYLSLLEGWATADNENIEISEVVKEDNYVFEYTIEGNQIIISDNLIFIIEENGNISFYEEVFIKTDFNLLKSGGAYI